MTTPPETLVTKVSIGGLRMRVSFSAAIVSFAFALAFPALSKADTFQTFALSGDPSEFAVTVSGTFTVDTTTGSITTVTMDPLQPGYAYTDFSQGQRSLNSTPEFAEFQANFYDPDPPAGRTNYDSATFIFPEANLIGYDGGSLCAPETPCGGTNLNSSFYVLDPTGSSFGSFIFDAAATPIAAAPEPATMALVGTGMLSAFGIVRRRLQR